MRDIWSFLLQTLTASGAAVLLLVLKAMFRDKLSPRWQFAVWGVLAMVLLLPAGYGGRYALLNWSFCVELLRSLLTGEYGALARVTAPVPLPAPAVPWTAEEWVFALYAAGAAALLARYAIAYVRLRLALRRGRPVEDGRVRAVAEAYRLPACPAVEVEGLPSAFVCGVLRPVLALPAGVETDEKVILHELLHLKYRDAAWGLAICLFRCLHWCNPLLWYCADLAGNDLESLCDQRVLERLEGEERRDYGRILLSMADEKYARAPGTSSMANGGKNIRRRIEAIARFKRYPAGMGLVSVCMLLVLAAPLAAGAKAAEIPGFLSGAAARMAYARTVPCTTCAGALDTYAKAAQSMRMDYWAMCAPLEEQNALAERCRTSGLYGFRGLNANNAMEYRIYNLTRTGEDTYEGLLALRLGIPPQGAERGDSRWLAVQPLRAEKEGARWVVIPQGEFQAVQGEFGVYENSALPCQIYQARWEGFTFQLRQQTASHISGEAAGGFSRFGDPQPGGQFRSECGEALYAAYHGDPAELEGYSSAGGAYAPILEEGERPKLLVPGVPHSGGEDGVRKAAGWRALEPGDWSLEEGVSLCGSGGEGFLFLDLTDRYAMSFYLDDKKQVELTLLMTERGTSLDGS